MVFSDSRSISGPSLCILCSDVPCGVLTHAVDGYLSIFIIQNEQKQEGKDEKKR